MSVVEFKVCPRCFIGLPLDAITDPVCRVCHSELKREGGK